MKKKKTLSFTLAGTDPGAKLYVSGRRRFRSRHRGLEPDKIEEFAESEPFKEYNVRQTDIKKSYDTAASRIRDVRLTEEKSLSSLRYPM